MIEYRPVYSGDPAILQELLRISQIFASLPTRLPVLSVAPERPRIGDLVICDGDLWAPLGAGVSKPIWFNGTTWESLT